MKCDQENGRVDEFRDKRSENQPRGTTCCPRSAVMRRDIATKVMCDNSPQSSSVIPFRKIRV
jgi:flavoprotein